MKVTCVLATRGRPDMLAITVAQTLINIRENDTRILVCADKDDAATVALLSHGGRDRRIVPCIKDREDDLGSKFNRALTEAPADVYVHMVDYAPIITPGFDTEMISAAQLWPDGIGLIETRFANTNQGNLTFCPAQGITAKFAAELGFIYPPYFPYWFIDHWTLDVAKMIGRLGFADVRVETSLRPGTQEYRESDWWATFYDVMAPMRQQQAKAIIRSRGFAAAPWQKDLALRRFPLINDRSVMMNNLVRGSLQSQLAPDERYTRIKAKAADMLAKVIAEMEAEAEQVKAEAA